MIYWMAVALSCVASIAAMWQAVVGYVYDRITEQEPQS